MRDLETFKILDTPPDPVLDDIVQLAASIFKIPTVAITIIDRHRQWVKANVGNPLPETSRELSICAQAILNPTEILVVPDLTRDLRFKGNPIVTGEHPFSFYAGAPLITSGGYALGTLCLFGEKKLERTPDNLNMLALLARQVTARLELLREQGRMEETINAVVGAPYRRSPVAPNEFTYLSPGIKRILGEAVSFSTPLRDPWFERVHPDDRSDLTAGLASISATGESCKKVYRVLADKGEIKWFEDVMRAKLSPSGQVQEISGTITDVTERQTKQERESKLALVGEMAFGIGHEINNPLTILLAKTDQIQRLMKKAEIEREAIIKAVTVIEKSAERIAKITRGLRRVARSSAGDRFESSSVYQLIDETLAFCSSRFSGDGIQIHFERPPSDLFIECRAGEISQVLLNLLSNASDAIEPLTERWIKVRVQDAGPNIQIVVTDSGKGIPDNIRHRLLTPFFTTKPPGKGTGLGLSISRTIVEAHHGKLSVDANSPNTEFVIELPKKQERNQSISVY